MELKSAHNSSQIVCNIQLNQGILVTVSGY
ncbi:hypothetical protein LOK49_LG12G02918 [Camellia lanceoleosa]|uniref:Uncharacterized protein n=1 Tax=Camellia lanceoleosa TaxID=1840588 RepID=A0ACC0FRF2_9ERIC|nr:hypothetical protein LOK49_LG12G02918 [Camellia lanceoleosa]